MIPAISPPVRIELSASRWLRWAVLGLTVLAVFAISASRLPEFSMLLVVPFAVWAWWQLLRQAGARLVFGEDGRAVELDADGREQAIAAIALHERGPLGVLVFSRAGKVRRVPFAPDALDADARRRLRLWMRRHAPEAPASWFAPSAKLERAG